MTSLGRLIIEAHLPDAAPGRAPSTTTAPRPDHLLIGPTVSAFVLRLADEALRGAPPAVRAIAWWDGARLAPAPGDDEARELLEGARRLGIPVLAPVAGACEPAYRESLAAPGRLIAACGMRPVASGAFGVACWHVSPLEAAALLCGAPLAPVVPAEARLVLTGSLPPGVGGTDAALEFARRAELRRWAGRDVEVMGPGVSALGMGERVALARGLAHGGAASVLLPSDDVTRAALRAWGRDADWRELRSADGAAGPALEIDLDTLEPLVAPASDPALARPLRHLLEHPLRAVSLGAFSDEDDVAVWLERLAGRSVAAGFDVSLVPGTAWFASSLAASGARAALEAAGVSVAEPHAAAETPRSFAGTRLGSGRPAGAEGGEWWLANPRVCAASALAGALADPRDGRSEECVAARRPRAGDARPAAPLPLPADPAAAPSAAAALVAPAAVGSLRAVVWLAVGDDWAAERIVSRSARARRALREDPVAGLFPGQDRQWTLEVGSESRGAVVAGRNFGGGEAADEAAWSLRRAGVAVVMARSFAPEGARALALAGVLALEADRRPPSEIAAAGEELEIPSLPEAVEPGHPVGVRNLTRGVQDTLHHGLDAEAVAVWRAGGLLARIPASVA